MTYAFPQHSLPYNAFASYTFPYTFILNTSIEYTAKTSDVDYLSVPITGLPDFGIPLSGITGTYLKVYAQNIAPSPQMYKKISDSYSLCYDTLIVGQNYISNAATYLAGIDVVDAKVDLFGIFQKTKNIVIDNGSVTLLLSSVTTLNNSVLQRSGLRDLNTWLSSNNVKVKSSWATLCNATGISIDQENIRN